MRTKRWLWLPALVPAGTAFGQDANTVLINVGVAALGSVFMKCFALGLIVVVALIAKRYLFSAGDVPKYRYRGRAKRIMERHEYARGSYLRSDYRHRKDDGED